MRPCKKALVVLITVVLLLPCAIASPHVRAASFTIDQNFTSNAQQSALQIEPGYIPGSDCAHWISSFLETIYSMPNNLGASWTDTLISNLIADGDVAVLTGDQSYDTGAFIPADQAASYFDSSSSSYLDNSMLEHSGNEEFIIAYKWNMNPQATPALADHVAVYVGSGQVVSHGIADSNGNEYNLIPRAWNGFEYMGTVAIIALTNGSSTSNPLPTSTSEAGHVLAATTSTGIVDSNGHSLPACCNGSSDANGALLLQGEDVVALDDAQSYQLNGYTYIYIAFPDPCQSGLDFSDNASNAHGSGAVGWVTLDALTETNTVQPDPQLGMAIWRDCWEPDQCGDTSYPNQTDTLSSKDTPILYAWWAGSYWDPHWWHVLDTGGSEAAVYGRDWSAINR